MVRATKFLAFGLLLCTMGSLIPLSSCGGGSSQPSGPSVSFAVNPNPILRGQSTTLTWHTSGATSVSIEGFGAVPASGSKQVTPTGFTAYTLTANGPGGTTTAKAQVTISTNKILHVVVIFQENRSPDNLFQDPVLIQRGADIQDTGRIRSARSSSWCRSPWVAIPTNCLTYNPDHTHKAFLDMWDNGKMDGADKIESHCAKARNLLPERQG